MTTNYSSNSIKEKYTEWSTKISEPGYLSGDTITKSDIYHGSLRVNGTLEVEDRDILKELDEMRDALLLLKRDVDMEAKYPRLRELKDEYERALEKYKTFEAIKESK